jgi:4-hydroxy-4-methyl-2-oxoglutarate aldolase
MVHVTVLHNAFRFPLCAALLVIAAGTPVWAQVFQLSPEQMKRYTAANPYDRFPDGRPKVPDDVLEKVKGLSAEEVFGLERRGYPNQFENHWQILRPEKKMVGRAVTLQLMPLRPDIADVDGTGLPSSSPRGQHISHQTAINLLQAGDVLVVDAHAIPGGIIGDNLGFYIFKKAAGFVIDGAIRDLDGLKEFDLLGYFREAVPPYLTSCMVTGINIPVQIGKATVMPGDVVFGDGEGVYFIPPQLVKEVVDHADETHIHDEWTKKKFAEGKYNSTDIYPKPSDPALQKEYQDYLKSHLGQH